MSDKHECCICNGDYGKYGNNPITGKLPQFDKLAAENDLRCCDECNTDFVIPMRMSRIVEDDAKTIDNMLIKKVNKMIKPEKDRSESR